MADVIRFPQERCKEAFADTYRAEQAVILILPVIRIDRADPEGPAPAIRGRGRRPRRERGLLSFQTEERVRAAFERLRKGEWDVMPDPGPAIGVGPFMVWPWPGDSGDETD